MESSPKRRKLDSRPTAPVDSPLTQENSSSRIHSIPLFVFTLVVEFVEEREFHSLIRAVPSLYDTILNQSSHCARNTLFTLRQSEHLYQRKRSSPPFRGGSRLYPPQSFVRRLRATLVVFDYPQSFVGMNDLPPTNEPEDGISGTVSAEFCGSEKYVEDGYCDSAKNIGISDAVGSCWDSIGLDCGCVGSRGIARRFPELRELVIDVRHSTCDGNSRTFQTVDEIPLTFAFRALQKLEIVQFEVRAVFSTSGIFHPYDAEILKKAMRRARNRCMFLGSKPPKYRRHALSFSLCHLSSLREIRCGFNSRDVKVQGRNGECPPLFEVQAYDCPKLEIMITERPLHSTRSLVFQMSPPSDLSESIRELKGGISNWLKTRSIKSDVLPNLESLGLYTVPRQWMNSYEFALRASQVPSLRNLECIGAVEVDLDRLTEFTSLEEVTVGGLEISDYRQREVRIPNLPNLRVLAVRDSDKTRIDALPNLESLAIQATIVSAKSEILSRLRKLEIVSGFLRSPDADPEACRTSLSASRGIPFSMFHLRRSTSEPEDHCITKITRTQFPSLEAFVYTIRGEGDAYFWETLEDSKMEGISEIEDGIASLRRVDVNIQVAQKGELSRWNEEGFVVPLRFESQVRVVKLTD